MAVKKRLQIIRDVRKNGLVANFTSKKPIVPKDKIGVSEITRESCLRPDIFLDNGKYCDGCPWSENCVCRLKRFHGKTIERKSRKNRS
jgi:hypothetical protein